MLFGTDSVMRSFVSVWHFAVDLLGGGLRIETEETEEQLARRMSGGDDHAFEVLYGRYFEKIYGFVKKRVGEHEIAEDLVSSVFMKVFVARKRFEWKVSFKTWVYQIANNTVIDYYRTKKTAVSFDPAVHDVGHTSTVTEDIDTQKLRVKLERAMSKLDKRLQTVLQLKFFAELDNHEIAEVLHLTPNHVGVLAHRAIKQCQAQLTLQNV